MLSLPSLVGEAFSCSLAALPSPPLPPLTLSLCFPLRSFLTRAASLLALGAGREASREERGSSGEGTFFFTPKPRHKKLKIVLDLVLPLRTVFFSFSHSPLLSIDTLERAFCKLSPPCRLTKKHNKIGGELVGFFFFFLQSRRESLFFLFSQVCFFVFLQDFFLASICCCRSRRDR